MDPHSATPMCILENPPDVIDTGIVLSGNFLKRQYAADWVIFMSPIPKNVDFRYVFKISQRP